MPVQIRVENLDFYNGLEALTMLHISDVHVWFSISVLEKLKAIIFQANPELILFTGDYYDTPRGAHLFRNFLCELSLSYKAVFIRGNHDFVYGSRIAHLLMGIPNCYCVEADIYRFISKKGYAYNITSWAQRHRLKKQKTETNIVLIHNPEQLQIKEMENIDLILAGHLHGGQFILFKTLKGAYFPGNLFYRFCTDRTQLKNTTLIISKGIGDTFPFRLNCAKEVIKIKII